MSLEKSLDFSVSVTGNVTEVFWSEKPLALGTPRCSIGGMDKRLLILITNGSVFQLNKTPILPPTIEQNDISTVKVADISLMESQEEENFYRVTALPVKGSLLHDADVGFLAEVPVSAALVISNCKASEGRAWIREQRDLDKRRAEEEAREQESAHSEEESTEEEERDDDDDRDERSEEEEKDQEQVEDDADRPAPALVAPMPDMLELPETGESVDLLPIEVPEPEATGELQVLEPIPIEIPVPDETKEGA